jgi:hypothetical protein
MLLLITNVLVVHEFLFLLLLQFLMLLASLIHVVGSTAADFHADSDGSDVVNIHDVPIIPAAVASLILMTSLR